MSIWKHHRFCTVSYSDGGIGIASPVATARFRWHDHEGPLLDQSGVLKTVASKPVGITWNDWKSVSDLQAGAFEKTSSTTSGRRVLAAGRGLQTEHAQRPARHLPACEGKSLSAYCSRRATRSAEKTGGRQLTLLWCQGKAGACSQPEQPPPVGVYNLQSMSRKDPGCANFAPAGPPSQGVRVPR